MSILLLLLLLLDGLVGGGGNSSESVPVEPAIEAALAPPAVASQVGVAVATPPAIADPAVAPKDWPVPGVIVDVAIVDEIRLDPTTKIVALTPADEYAAGHIPGAIQIDWKPFEIIETGDQQVDTWRVEVERLLTELGITPADTVVVYDGGTFYASRLWWVLDQLGHDNKLILDGGLAAWQSAGMPVETGPGPVAAREPADPYVGAPNETAIATIDEVEAALDDPNVVLVDARTPEEYAKGHLPGAVNIPFIDNAAPDSGGRWRSPEELRALYAAAGVTEDMTVIPYCLTGVRSAATYVTLTALGYPDVSLFTGSWAEWSADPSRPVEG